MATLHEAWIVRADGAGNPSDSAGRQPGGQRGNRAGDARRQLDVSCGGRAVPRRRYSGGGPPTSPCGDGFFGDLLATSLNRAAWSVWWAISAFVIRRLCGEMGFAVWSRQVYAQGTVKESPGSVNVPVICAGQLVQPGDVVVADDDGVVVLPHAQVRDVPDKAEARVSNELAKRERMRHGELGLDIYAMRPRLAERGPRYYDRADEVEE
ncbi:4-carboxy-4-hydroxy-2-oxoadipate aldolase/oxaloacetate decarboxylase [Klebsiella variicola subsp. variicola]|nr:4-carboxy-4-hydroxy-2-oxoadipate aldolase/oxaloacetate decarboxylase [Klebsiella variicola subsp. variicola]